MANTYKHKTTTTADKVPVAGDLILGEIIINVTDGKAYLKKADNSIIEIGAVKSVAGKTGAVTLAKADVGLGNVDNTSDTNKPVSTATQTALNGKANSSHSHAISDVTNLQTSLDAKIGSSRAVNTSGLASGGGNLSADRTITVPKADATTLRAATDDTVAVTPKSIADSMAEIQLTDGGTINWDMATGYDFRVTLGGNRNLANPSNIVVGKKGRLRVAQDGGGNRGLTFGNYFKFAGGTAFVTTKTANAVDYLYYDVRSSTEIILSFMKDVK